MKNKPQAAEGTLETLLVTADDRSRAALSVSERIDKLEKLSRQRAAEAREAIQMKLFPMWPDDRRGAPNDVIRSAIFGVVKTGKRKRVVKMPIASPAGSAISLTGWRLDQHDADVWLEVMHLARKEKPGDKIRFKLNTLLRQLGKTDGGRDREWLKHRLEALAETTIAYDDGRFAGVAGAMISHFSIDRKSGDVVLRTNPELRALWDDVTHLNIEDRRSLGSNQLAKALHAMLSSHAAWTPMRLDTLMQRVGAEYARLRAFRAALELVLDDFSARGWVRSYKIGRGDSGLITIDKVQTPTQARALAARNAPSSL